MLDKRFLESFLKMNASGGEMSPGEVKAVLTKAGWSDTETEAALSLLRGNDDPDTMISLQGGNPTAFRPDMEFSSQDLSKLLGVDVIIDPAKVADPHTSLGHDVGRILLKTLAVLVVVFFSLSVAIGIAAAAAYMLGLGPFSGRI